MKHINKLRVIFAMIFGMMLSICLTVPTYAAEKEGSCGEMLTWSLSDHVLTINGSGDMTDYADGALAPWFGLAGDISEIHLPDGMTSSYIAGSSGYQLLIPISCP